MAAGMRLSCQPPWLDLISISICILYINRYILVGKENSVFTGVYKHQQCYLGLSDWQKATCPQIFPKSNILLHPCYQTQLCYSQQWVYLPCWGIAANGKGVAHWVTVSLQLGRISCFSPFHWERFADSLSGCNICNLISYFGGIILVFGI